MNPKTFSETDLYRPLHDYLVAQGYTVRSEVKGCDIAAVKDGELVLIEMKKSITLGLITQAVARRQITDSVYVAVPRPSNMRRWVGRSKDLQGLLRRLELGLILVSLDRRKPEIEIRFHPAPFQNRKRRTERRAVLEEIGRRSGDFNQGGSCRQKLVTAYRENAVRIACLMADHGPMSPGQLRELGTGDKTLDILYKNVYGWFDRIGRALYALSPRGRSDLDHSPELVQRYLSPPSPPVD